MTVFALVDCNNFYASCERLFRPDLVGQPIVVLSNNDGCIVARSAEAKALNINMAVPVHQIQDTLAQHGVRIFSSNYALYGDLSNRVMHTLEALAPVAEVYSIDEAFLDLTGVDNVQALTEFGYEVRNTVQQHVGITVSVGIAPSKTLAKLANHAAKKYKATQGVVDLTDPTRQEKLLRLVQVGDVWGVGRRLRRRLNDLDIVTAWDLAKQSPRDIGSRFSVVLERTVRELNGESCLDLDDVPATKQQIICSRSFGQRITRQQEMREAIGSYTARGAEKLRQERQRCRSITVFIRTGVFNSNDPQYANSATLPLEYPTDDTRTLLTAANSLLNRLWKDGFRYAKGGIVLNDFYDHGVYQPDFFAKTKFDPKSPELMALMDSLNKKHPKSLLFARQGLQHAWAMKRDYLSPAYTTHWSALPRVR
ncbi:MAG: translesion error-prone DNA polymerase V subunit UmuC [Oleibacter sp.]|nr:translesion error-prone DNA polymerase V subunit UmuC [Thalassolituus sp.]